MCYFYREERKTEQKQKKQVKNLRNDQRKFDYFQKREKLSLALLKSHGVPIRLEQIFGLSRQNVVLKEKFIEFMHKVSLSPRDPGFRSVKAKIVQPLFLSKQNFECTLPYSYFKRFLLLYFNVQCTSPKYLPKYVYIYILLFWQFMSIEKLIYTPTGICYYILTQFLTLSIAYDNFTE